MSVKELKFLDDIHKSENIVKFENDELQFFHEGEEFFALNRSEAYLLMLYLQEHLKPVDSYNGTRAYPDEN